jgi:hypothetical protein
MHSKPSQFLGNAISLNGTDEPMPNRSNTQESTWHGSVTTHGITTTTPGTTHGATHGATNATHGATNGKQTFAPQKDKPLEHLDKAVIGMRLSKEPLPLRKTEVCEESSSDDIPSPSTGVARTDPYATRELCKSLLGTPVWDGKSLNWRSFLKEWKAFWGFQKGLVGSKAKKWIFIKSLPEKWQCHMKAYITDYDWSYRDIVDFLDKQCHILITDWKKLQAWRSCMPLGVTYMYFTHWYLTWCRLGKECDLRTQDWVHQFDTCMNFKSFFTKLL